MKDFISSAFSETANKEIAAIESAAGFIHPGNMSFISPANIVFNEKPGAGINEFDDAANVNGFDMLKINGMIRDLKTNKIRILVASGVKRISSVSDQITIQAPEGYDGRDAFVSYSVITSIPSNNPLNFKIWCTRNSKSILFEVKNCFQGKKKLRYLIIYRKFV